ncbi:MAG: hypothetical protein H5T78_26320 [Nocardia sp.]|nr:hypothetical protein [Nocardia sp.]
MTTTAVSEPLSAPRVLAVLVAVITAFGALLADFVIPAGAAQHLRNDAWPPHAKFHDAQYIAMSMLLGALALTLLLRPLTRSRLWTACAILATPWLGLLAAMLFPGTAIHDPEFSGTTIISLHPQVLLAVILLAVLAAAVALSGRAER